MAAAFPQASFTGIDNDSYALPNSTMPSNVEFELADAVKQKLPFADESFDFIFVSLCPSLCPLSKKASRKNKKTNQSDSHKFFGLRQLRAMSVSIGENEWPLLLKEIWRVLKPGGFFEKMDISETICPPQAVYSKKWEQGKAPSTKNECQLRLESNDFKTSPLLFALNPCSFQTGTSRAQGY